MDLDKERELVEECVHLQLSEFELIKAMYPLHGEVVASEDSLNRMKNSKLLKELSNFSMFDYNVNIDQYKLNIQLPLLYPVKEKADIYIRSNSICREEQFDLNNKLKIYLNTLEDNDLIVSFAISWLQEYKNNTCHSELVKDTTLENESWDMGRFWIVSHHIYSKTKRKDMKSFASEFKLNGFCLPGKPGIICIEGTLKNVSAWWQRVRSWTWQRIKNIREETKSVHSPTEEKSFYRFPAYKELTSDDIKTKSERSFNMGEFFKYLEQHKSGYVFAELFSL